MVSKYRCYTCESFNPEVSDGESGMGVCAKTHRVVKWQQWTIINDVGCASHNALRGEREIREDEQKRTLIKVFEEVMKLANESTSTEATYAYNDVIRIIHGFQESLRIKEREQQ